MEPIITLPSTALKAALLFAPESDIRYYLNGVHVECTHTGDVHVVATDGTAVFVHKEMGAQVARPGPWAFTLARASLAKLLKDKAVSVSVFATPDGFAIGGGDGLLISFKAVEGKFPDWRRILPREESMSGQASLYSTDILAAAGKALAYVDGLPARAGAYHGELHQNGTAPGVVVGKTGNTVVAIAPRRITAKNPMAADWFVPAAYEAPTKDDFTDLA